MKLDRTPSPHAEEQASLWAARLEGSTLSAQHRTELDAWLEADPSHRALLSSYCQFSADLEQHLPLLEGIRNRVAEIHQAPAPVLSSSWLRWPAWAGVTLAAAAAVAFFFLRPDGTQFANFTTPVAQRQALTLADGTHVDLNAHTSLQVELDRTTRRVRLASGQAFFEVTKDPNRPFIVETPAGTVRVTGTAFDVRSDPDLLEVTVQEGHVQVNPSAAPAPTQLTAGGQLTARRTGIDTRTLSAGELGNILLWRQGQVVFKDVRLDEVLARVSRFHGRNLTAGPAAAGLSIGGLYSFDDLDAFLNDLQVVYPELRVAPDADGAIRVTLRPAR